MARNLFPDISLWQQHMTELPDVPDIRSGGPSGMYPASEIPDPPEPTDGKNDLYTYAMLSAMLGSAGAGLGMAFRPWVKPPQPLPSPQAPQMPITAPASLSALAQTRSGRKGF